MTTITQAHADEIANTYKAWMNRTYSEEILVAKERIRSYWMCYGAGPTSRATPYLVVRTNDHDIYTMLNFINFVDFTEFRGAKRLIMGDDETTVAFEIKG